MHADTNECLVDSLNACEQLCNNTHGSHSCLCLDGYRLNSDGFSCTGMEIKVHHMHVCSCWLTHNVTHTQT